MGSVIAYKTVEQCVSRREEINDEDKRVDRNHFQSLQDPKLQDLETDFDPSGVVFKAERRKKNR